jgi:TonB-dependent receptor
MRIIKKLSVGVIASLALIAGSRACYAAQVVSGVSSKQKNTVRRPKTALLKTVVVTGAFVEGLEKSMDIKRYSPEVVDALSLSDLGQLPDLDVAEALASLPGIGIERDPTTGAASQISVRGMPEELTQGLLNGDALASATQTGNLRYDMFPPNLIGSVLVYKSPMASLNAGGIAATIDLQTLRPLSFKKSTIIASAEGEYSPLGAQLARAKSLGRKWDLTYIGEALHHTLGFAVGYSQRSLPVQYATAQFATYNPSDDYEPLNSQGVDDMANYGVEAVVSHGTDDRQGALAVLQWRPNNRIHLYLDGLYSRVTIFQNTNGLQTYTADGEFTNTYTNVVTQNQQIVSGTITENCAYGCTLGEEDGLTMQNISALTARNDKFYTLQGSLGWHPDRANTVRLNFGWSHVREISNYGAITTDYVNLGANGVPTNVANGQSLTEDGLDSPVIIGTNVDLANPLLNRVASLSVPYYHDGHETFYEAKLNFTHQFDTGFISALSAGVRAVDHKKSILQPNQSATIAIADQTVLPASAIESSALGSYSGPIKFPPFLTFNYAQALDEYFGGFHPSMDNVTAQTASWLVRQPTLAGFVQADYRGTLFGWPYGGNVGVRVTRTFETSSSMSESPITGNLVPFSVTNDYTNVLPSFNFAYRPGKWVLRAAVADAISRPEIDDLNAGFTTYCAGGPGVGCDYYGGNPHLRPFRDTQGQVNAAYYYGKNSYASAAVYYDELHTWIETSEQNVNVGGINYLAYLPVNGHGGYVRGVALSWQNQFSWLPSPFNGLGFWGTYTYNQSDIINKEDFSAETTPLLGLSKYVYDVMMYYSKGPITARVGYNYRSAFGENLAGGGFALSLGGGFLAAQVSYKLPMGLSLVISGDNLTNNPEKTQYTSGAYGNYQEFGREIFFGFRYRHSL